jgi:hypothetical protein
MDYDWFETAKRIAGKDAKVPQILLENNPIEIRHVRINQILNANTTPHETAGDFVEYLFQFCLHHNVDLNLIFDQHKNKLEREIKNENS